MSVLRLASGIVLVTLCYGVPLFAGAGTLHWPRAWVLIALTVVSTTISTAYLTRTSPEIVAERWKGPVQKGQPLADRILVVAFIVLYLATILATALDAFHWHLLPAPAPIVAALGLGLYLSSWFLVTRVLRENAFASASVRYQEERHQRVIDTGPYAIVRHPMYAGSIPLILGLPLWLGSYAITLAGVFVVLVMTVRILVEEAFLRGHLPGYEDYMRRVRWRLIPGIW